MNYEMGSLYLCGVTPAPVDRFGMPNASLIKVSLGAEKTVAWKQFISTILAVDAIKDNNYSVCALEQNIRSINYMSQKLHKYSWTSSALIIGGEVNGIKQNILNYADICIEIPMYGTKESLNVSVACGIALYRMKEILTIIEPV